MADDPADRSALPLDPTLLQLPAGFASTGDPVDGNPFSPGNFRHELWARATRIAEEKAARVKSTWLASGQRLDATPRSLEEMEQFNAAFRERHRQLLSDEFHVWAERVCQVIFTDADVQAMDSWLVGYAAACLDSNARLMLKHGLPTHLVERELRWMRDRLAALVQHYEAENRRCRGVREEEARQHSATQNNVKPEHSSRASPGDPAQPPTPPRRKYPKRAQWLALALENRKWTVQELERQGGPNAKTTRRLLGGEYVRDTVLEKLALALSGKGHVAVADIPSD